MTLLPSADSPEASHALKRLIEGDFETRWDAAKQIVRLGTSVLPALLALLSEEAAPTSPNSDIDAPNKGASQHNSNGDSDDYDIELHWFIARILGDLEHPVAVDALLDLAQTAPHPEVAAIAATSLAKAGQLALPALTTLLQQPKHRILAVQALSQLGHSTAIPALLSVVNDADETVRAVAVEALTAFRDRRITPILAQALDDKSSTVRLAALRGIGSRGNQLAEIDALIARTGELLGDLNLDVSCQAAIALGRLNHPIALSHLNQTLYHSLMPLALKIQSIRALAWRKNEQALDLLKQYLFHLIQPLAQAPSSFPSSDLEGEATIATHPSKTPGLHQVSASHSLSLEIIRVLGRIEDSILADQAADLLLETLTHCSKSHGSNSPSVSQAHLLELQASIALSLGQLGRPQAFAPLMARLSHPSPHLRFHVLAALKRLNPDGGRQQLAAAQKHPTSEELAQGIAFALTEWS